MRYISTRGGEKTYTGSQVILKGLADDGGLFVPDTIPQLSENEFDRLKKYTYADMSAFILSKYLDEFSFQELKEICALAYSEEAFGEEPCPLVQLNPYNENEYMLELWHGPTSAFKDIALQILPHLMKLSAEKNLDDRRFAILTATSGDTGKAALEGFSGVQGFDVIVFYPEEGVSEAQKLQMKTSEGENCHVAAVSGNFDDAQTAVKRIFSDTELERELGEKNIKLSSANSINWGRLCPQISYYVYSYIELLKREKIEFGEKVNFIVPTGNFGDILAGWYAKQMGVPVGKLILASNQNNVLTDFFSSGVYDIRRKFYKTLSPSMDILISSNLERLLFELSYQNASYVKERMNKLKTDGFYSVGPEMLSKLEESFGCGFCGDKATVKTIRAVYDSYDHLVDPHTAVGFNVYPRYSKKSNDENKHVFLATASPFKFPAAVCEALERKFEPGRELDELPWISEESGMQIPEGLSGLREKPVLHEAVILPEETMNFVRDLLI